MTEPGSNGHSVAMDDSPAANRRLGDLIVDRGLISREQLEDARPPGESLSVFGKNVHECGTARMGTDPKKSVVNGFGQVHDVRNVFVTDGSVFVTQGCYEPTLTIMAISARAADYMTEEYRRGNL